MGLAYSCFYSDAWIKSWKALHLTNLCKYGTGRNLTDIKDENQGSKHIQLTEKLSVK